jgi:hypothetical protein
VHCIYFDTTDTDQHHLIRAIPRTPICVTEIAGANISGRNLMDAACASLI